MPYARNPMMVQRGYVPAVDLARVMGKALSTIHRLAHDEKVKSARDGRQLYIKLASFEAYLSRTENTVILDALKEYKKTELGGTCG